MEISEAKHRMLANLIPQIIFTISPHNGITFANEQWVLYSGQALKDCAGLGFMDFMHPDDLEKFRIPSDQGGEEEALGRPSLSEILVADTGGLVKKGIIKLSTEHDGKLSFTTEVRLRCRTGEYRWHLIRCIETDAIDFGGGISSFFCSATEINDQKLLEARLKEAMESKGRFLSNMSHEIRTPLLGILGIVSFLQETTLTEEQRDYTNTIQTSAKSLMRVINDILDLSKVDAGMMRLKREWFHTRSLIEDANELVSPLALNKHLELNYVVDEDVPDWVKGDRVRIRQVLLNLIGNAIKFTSAGEVFSRCRVRRRESDEEGPLAADAERSGIMLEFAIMDTGRGFSQEEAELIFKPFSQIDGNSARQDDGSGLGLVISRQLTELHGGTMTGSAVPGQGSTFTFTARFRLPTATDYPDAMSLAASGSGGGRFSGSIPVDLRRFSAHNLARCSPPPASPTASPTTTAATATTEQESLSASSALASSGASDPSVRSAPSSHAGRGSDSSATAAAGLSRFGEAAKAAIAQDLGSLKLKMRASPSSASSPSATQRPDNNDAERTQAPSADLAGEALPTAYSILIICPQMHSREATAQHIEMTLPKDVERRITALGSVEEAQPLIGGRHPTRFTHIVLNLPSAEAMISTMDQVAGYDGGETTILILSDPGERQTVLQLANAKAKHAAREADKKLIFVSKPVKPSRFAVIFDPHKVSDASIDRNRSSAQRVVENQKASYDEIEKRVRGKGYRVLLVEDNPVNQKVMKKYLAKVGVEVEMASDGDECVSRVFAQPHGYYALILCDLYMPRKDGYQACREIRQWEADNGHGQIPIIALSANVMSEVQGKCLEAGFDSYITKPVDFIQLSNSIGRYLVDDGASGEKSPP